jgi:poly-gamma-glutamate capsule biosynthesis protein CapA/YwtB (metallophosphatase superfamily)
MDRRSFLKTAARAAAIASAGKIAKLSGGFAQAAAPDRLTLAAVGDCILARRVSQLKDPDFLGLVDLLHGVDASWGNCELVLADPRQVYPALKEGDPHTIGDPWVADEFRFLGLRLMGTANNHIEDFGHEGLFATLENLDRVGIAHAGAGADLAAAARAGTFDSAAGRIADVNCASTFLASSPAGPAHPYLRGRPGLNPLHVDTKIQIGRDLFARMKEAEDQIERIESDPASRIQRDPPEPSPPTPQKPPTDTAYFDQSTLQAGDRVDLLPTARAEDVKRITDAIRVARRTSRIVLATIHAHEQRGRPEVPDVFLPTFAHATLDAGADLFVGAGPHVLRGIEIYKGKPIFYSLGNFFFQHESIHTIPTEDLALAGLDPGSLDFLPYAQKIGFQKQKRFWQSVVPRLTWEGERLAAIDLHPVTLGFGLPVDRRGTPRLARGEEATQILTGLAELSKPFGTTIAIEDGIGRVRLG